MRTLRTALLGVLVVSATASAQTYYYGDPQPSSGPFYGSVVYQLGIPIGNTHDYISDVEWRGVGVDLGWMVKPSFST